MADTRIEMARQAARTAFGKRVRSANTAPRPYTLPADPYSTNAAEDVFVPEKKTNPYGRRHPMNNADNHLALVTHVIERATYARSPMEQRAARFSHIDRALAGFLRYDEDDKRRARDNARGKGIRPVDSILNLGLNQLDECLTYLMSVFAPESGIFTAVAAEDVQAIANAFAQRMNKDSDKFKYYREIAKWFLNGLKYNVGGVLTEWKEVKGIVYQTEGIGPAAQPVRKTDVVWRGNEITNLDMYNTFWDPTVHPVSLNRKGEFFGTVDIFRKFDILRMASNSELFDVWKFLNYGQVNAKFYQPKPDVRLETDGYGSVSGQGNTDWFKVMSGGAMGDVSKGYEIINYYGWLVPKKFGLSDSVDYEIWRITVANSAYITRTDPVDATHGMLPISMISPWEDDLGLQQKSYGEQLIPLQTFASSLMNVHQRANRKGLYGVTFYNPNVVPLGDKKHEDLESGKVPVSPPGYGEFDIRKHIYQLSDVPQTEKTMEDIDNIIKLMQKILPTDILKQVADLQRATTYQAASVVQGGNRRNLKMARMIEDQGMKDVRFICMYNIYDKLTDPLTYLDSKTGQSQQFSPAQVIDAGVEFAMAEGLKGIDKIYIIEVYKELLGMIVQSQQALQKYDFVGMMNYISDLMGDKTNLAQFQNLNPLDQLPPDQQQLLVGLLQSGQLTPLMQAYANQLRGHGATAAQNVVPMKGQPGQAQSDIGQPGTQQPALGGDD